MPRSRLLTQKQLMSIIQLQIQIAKLGLDSKAVMATVVDKIQEMTNAKGVVIELPDGDEMLYSVVSQSAASLLGIRLKKNHSLSGLCYLQNEIFYSPDAENDPRIDPINRRKIEFRSMVVVPLAHVGEPLGVLKVYSEHLDGFGEQDIQILSLLAEQVAAAIYHSSRYGAEELYQLATRDSLTRLANRSLFRDRLHLSISQAKQDQHLMAILAIDMDGLKKINDQFGHRFGDEAIKEIARRLVNAVGKEDLVARLGGDEFAIILNHISEASEVVSATAHIEQLCSMPFEFEDKILQMSASIGSAVFPDEAQTIEKLQEMADLRMYKSKRERKNQRQLLLQQLSFSDQK
ncbi:sensor domain-containing diguanylate cyclase [Acinetobacter gerneri]|uniref:GGDEF domain-containing protein n=2 Tax=Acinetobacter gerneri TaxID=202952 RepID=N8YC49_9GAMM|nr:sensor domain-containing diguanylate cyclase [Acinetobacter gerneri]ENV34206.1 hypothetical protein F960_01524 [Acinetobacter gerneri DSM 14967 = CIP 107464 = MTCC 9824]EPR84639.1 Sensory box/GGDEF family protein [Acinetobacter gerneri DSM 14967 = CIP 107464 = MTCC 9824]MCH4245146.1 sensor domain-containing diguanylate cyclase [Acinetobacter gerneri]MDQ9011331.1 sensor domain-containing diguanylate cyclase [Acinetobacter gerneri]MDQ9015467.1 sensor domain-containing diguanylate cyclase [Aci